jgi:predicted transcriptional regulator
MATMTIRLPDEKHRRLRQLAKSHGVSVNRLVDDLSSVALAQYDAELRFKALSARGNANRGLRLLDKLDRVFGKKKRS